MFSIVTSAFFSRERTISSPRGDLRFKVSDFLLALNWWKYQGSLSGWPGRRRRPGSPVVGFSILTTSAPSQARDSVQDGPASNWVKSTTLIPSRQSSSTPISAIARSSWAAMLEYLLAARNPPDSRRAVHGKEDSPGIHRSQHPCDLGRAVALSGAAGEPRGRADGGLHHPTRDRGSGARGVRREARVHRFPGDGGIEGDRRGGRGGARAGPLRADQGGDRSRQARLHRMAARPHYRRSGRAGRPGPRQRR